MPTAGVKDRHYRQLLARITSLLAAALLAKTKCSTQSELLVQDVRLVQTSLKAHLAKRLQCGLRYKSKAAGSEWLLGSQLDTQFTDRLRVVGPEWQIRLVEGESDAKFDSILGTNAEERPLFADVSLQFRVVGNEAWRVDQPIGGNRHTMPQRFAGKLFMMLPIASRKRREGRAMVLRK